MEQAPRASAMTESVRMENNLWFWAPLALDEVAAQVMAALGTTVPDHDAENLYEWFVVTTSNGVRLDVSRKHDRGEPIMSEPIRIMTSSSVAEARRVAQILAGTFGRRVSRGTVVYLGRDDFDYHEIEGFEP
jgi:hypothetical protein